jgi:hypothetical protein
MAKRRLSSRDSPGCEARRALTCAPGAVVDDLGIQGKEVWSMNYQILVAVGVFGVTVLAGVAQMSSL